MARVAGISDEDIQKVRAATDLVSLFSERVPLRQRGRDFWCCCPFHDEKSPSCKIDPATQQFYCFGCHEHGDVFSFVMKTEDIDFPDAVRRLADRAHIELHESGGRGGVSRSYKERLRGVCQETRNFYHQQLMRLKSPEADAARSYLASRGLGGQVPAHWHLGFAPGHGVLMRHLRSRGYTVKEMVDANVVVSRDNAAPRDRFFNRIMFPIHDEQGECIAFGGRVVGSGEPKYLNSQDTPLFHKSNILFGLDAAKAAMTASGQAIVVEGYTDVIALSEAGVKNVVATLGTALTTQHIRSLSRHAGQRVIYLFDGDEAGQRATDRALGFIDESMTPEAGKVRIDLLACTLPDGLDPADFVDKYGADALRAELKQAKPLIAFGIDRHLAQFDLSTPEGRTAAFADALALLAPIKDSLLAQDYAVQIAGRLHFREDDALERLSRLQPPRRAQVASSSSSSRNADHQDRQVALSSQPQTTSSVKPAALPQSERTRRRFEAALIRVCAHHPHLTLTHADALAQTNWHEALHAQAADALLDCVAKNPTASPAEAAAAITQRAPDATVLLVSRSPDPSDIAAFAAYLVEELSLGDLSDTIDAYRSQLARPDGLDSQERELLFQTVAGMQRDLAVRRQAQRDRSTFTFGET